MIQDGNLTTYQSTAEIVSQLQRYEAEYGYTARDAEQRLSAGEIGYTEPIADWLSLARHWEKCIEPKSA